MAGLEIIKMATKEEATTKQLEAENRQANEEELQQYNAKREGDAKMQDRINNPANFAKRQEIEARKADREARKERGEKLSKGELEQEKRDQQEEQKLGPTPGTEAAATTTEASKEQVTTTTEESKKGRRF